MVIAIPFRTFLQNLKTLLRLHRGRIFLFSDTHFNDKKILKYCNRPFRGVREMNAAIVSRWNKTVGPDDEVWFLGDFVYYGSAREWERELNGTIRFIRGNHDRRMHFARKRTTLEYRGYRFLLVHDPAHVPPSWDGWVIHGHTHNNRRAEYPFINGAARTINVSAELTGYAPVPLDEILDLDPGTILRMESRSSVPVRKNR